MKAYYTTDFEGYYPVGQAAVVYAIDRRQAKRLLRKAIIEKGLRDPGTTFEVVEVQPGQAVVVVDGDY